MGKYHFGIKVQEGSWRFITAGNSKEAHSQRSELVKDPQIVEVSPIRPVSDMTLPIMLKKTIKGGVEFGRSP